MKEKPLYGDLCKSEYKCDKENECEFREGQVCPHKVAAKRYEMECIDDKILIKTTCTKEITLRQWHGVEEDE